MTDDEIEEEPEDGAEAESEGLLTLLKIAEMIELDPKKRNAVVAKMKRFGTHEAVRVRLGAQRAGGKGYRWPHSAVPLMKFLVSNPLVTASNVDSYLSSLTAEPAPFLYKEGTEGLVTRENVQNLFGLVPAGSLQGISGAEVALEEIKELVGNRMAQVIELGQAQLAAELRQEAIAAQVAANQAEILTILREQAAAAKAKTRVDSVLTRAKAAEMMGVAESSVSKHIPPILVGHYSYQDVSDWIDERRKAAWEKRQERIRSGKPGKLAPPRF